MWLGKDDDADYDVYVSHHSNDEESKAVRDFVSLEQYTLDEDDELIDKNGEPCDWKDITELFRVYTVKKCMCPTRVADKLLDIWPEIFDGVELDLR